MDKELQHDEKARVLISTGILEKTIGPLPAPAIAAVEAFTQQIYLRGSHVFRQNEPSRGIVYVVARGECQEYEGEWGRASAEKSEEALLAQIEDFDDLISRYRHFATALQTPREELLKDLHAMRSRGRCTVQRFSRYTTGGYFGHCTPGKGDGNHETSVIITSNQATILQISAEKLLQLGIRSAERFIATLAKVKNSWRQNIKKSSRDCQWTIRQRANPNLSSNRGKLKINAVGLSPKQRERLKLSDEAINSVAFSHGSPGKSLHKSMLASTEKILSIKDRARLVSASRRKKERDASLELEKLPWESVGRVSNGEMHVRRLRRSPTLKPTKSPTLKPTKSPPLNRTKLDAPKEYHTEHRNDQSLREKSLAQYRLSVGPSKASYTSRLSLGRLNAPRQSPPDLQAKSAWQRQRAQSQHNTSSGLTRSLFQSKAPKQEESKKLPGLVSQSDDTFLTAPPMYDTKLPRATSPKRRKRTPSGRLPHFVTQSIMEDFNRWGKHQGFMACGDQPTQTLELPQKQLTSLLQQYISRNEDSQSPKKDKSRIPPSHGVNGRRRRKTSSIF